MSKTKLIINNNGSIKIEGDFEIMDSSGMYGLEGRTALGLCRCGLSASKPFCDGSSKYFEHESKAFDLPNEKEIDNLVFCLNHKSCILINAAFFNLF
jgi:CDGSH-type Zn-finger protein